MLRYKALKMKNDEFDCICYGLVAQKFENSNWNTIAAIKDISCDKEFVISLAEKCTAGQLDPVHILDVVLDAIS